MEIGHSVVSTEEYIRLREIQDKYKKALEELEANVDKILVEGHSYDLPGVLSTRRKWFVGKDEALVALQNTLDAVVRESADRFNSIERLTKEKIQWLNWKPNKSLGARLRFLFTGEMDFPAQEIK